MIINLLSSVVINTIQISEYENVSVLDEVAVVDKHTIQMYILVVISIIYANICMRAQRQIAVIKIRR